MTENIGQISSTGGVKLSTRIAILKVTLPHKIYLDVGILSTFLVACESSCLQLDEEMLCKLHPHSCEL